jgi:hypothetical protein
MHTQAAGGSSGGYCSTTPGGLTGCGVRLPQGSARSSDCCFPLSEGRALPPWRSMSDRLQAAC